MVDVVIASLVGGVPLAVVAAVRLVPAGPEHRVPVQAPPAASKRELIRHGCVRGEHGDPLAGLGAAGVRGA
eukprot:1593411-Alexandrium_andersonii.AAC.1